MALLDARAARATCTVLLIAGLCAAAWVTRKLLVALIIAMLFAYLLSPLVNLVNRWFLKESSRTISLALVYVAFLTALATAAALLGSRLAEETTALARRLPQYLDPQRNLAASIPLPAFLEPYRQAAIDLIRDRLQENAHQLVPFLQRLGSSLLSLLGNAAYLLVIVVMSFFFLKDGSTIRRTLAAQVQEPQRARVESLLLEIDKVLSEYMRALILMCFCTFVCYALFFSVAGVPYALLLSLLAGVLELLPVVGTLSAGATCVLVAWFTGYESILLVVVFLIVYRLFLDYVIQPYLMSSGVELPPGAVIFAVLAGEHLAGVTGMVLAIPAVAILRVVYVRLLRHRETGSAPA